MSATIVAPHLHGDEGISGPDALKDLYIAISSIRYGYNILMENLAAWLPTVLEFTNAAGLEPEANLASLWQPLGLEEDVLQSLVRFGLRAVASL